MKHLIAAASAALSLLAAAPALAQDMGAAEPLPSPDEIGDIITVGAGVGYLPDYEGSDDYRIIPAAALRASVGGYSIYTSGTTLFADVIAKRPGQKFKFDLGPSI